VRLKARLLEGFEYHSFCAILDDPDPSTSGLKCWGSNDYCELGLGSTESGRGADPGSLGNNLAWIDIGTTASGGVRKAVALAAGFQSICVLGDDGAIKCWGTNRSGELGIGTTGDPRSCSPADMGNAGLVSLPAPAVSISARREHACAVLMTGVTTCWGVNTFGQLGTGDTANRLSPSDPLVFPPGFTPVRLVLGDDHACAISAEERVECWGSDQKGQLGPQAAGGDWHVPGPDVRVHGSPVVDIAAGGNHTCAILTGGGVKCWGRNAEGQLGAGDTTNRGDRPDQMGDNLLAVALDMRATAVAAGATHTCAVLAGGAVECWGGGDAGQLGQGTASSLATPSPPVALPAAATAIAAGDDFSCALLTDGRVFCWGGGARGQLGSGDVISRAAPGSPVALPRKARAIVTGSSHACAVLENQTLACWGANDAGQLGVGDTQDRPRPALVALGSNRVLAVATRVDSTCVLLDDHGVTCWGRNARGQLGAGDAMDRDAPPPAPIDLGSGRKASSLAVGGAFACAVLDTKQAKCWGDNQTNQLGAPLRGPAYGDELDEMGDFLAAAVQGGGRQVRALAAGRAHACAILDTGDLRCWGDNGDGQLGTGDAAAHSLFLAPTGIVDLGGGP
jgi:alpha-tubulin suppressor-like RCC1 family protein